MALKNFKPVTPSLRQLVIVDRSGLWKGKPVKQLTEGLHSKGGRNNLGRIITCEFIMKRHQRQVFTVAAGPVDIVVRSEFATDAANQRGGRLLHLCMLVQSSAGGAQNPRHHESATPCLRAWSLLLPLRRAICRSPTPHLLGAAFDTAIVNTLPWVRYLLTSSIDV